MNINILPCCKIITLEYIFGLKYFEIFINKRNFQYFNCLNAAMQKMHGNRNGDTNIQLESL